MTFLLTLPHLWWKLITHVSNLLHLLVKPYDLLECLCPGSTHVLSQGNAVLLYVLLQLLNCHFRQFNHFFVVLDLCNLVVGLEYLIHERGLHLANCSHRVICSLLQLDLHVEDLLLHVVEEGGLARLGVLLVDGLLQ